MKITQKQYLALKVLGDNEGKPMMLRTLLERVPYHPTKQAFQFTLRQLIEKGCVVKKQRIKMDNRSHRLLAITALGLEMMREYEQIYSE